MPSPTDVALTSSASKLTKVGDGSAEVPISIAESSTIYCVISFEDGYQKDFSTDSRTVYSLDSTSAEMITISTTQEVQTSSLYWTQGGTYEAASQATLNVVTVLDDATITASSQSVTISVAFTVFDVTGSLSLTVVQLDTVSLWTVPYPTVSGWSGGSVTTLNKITCSGVRQRLETRATYALSDGTTSSAEAFYKRVTYTSSSTPVAAFSSAPSDTSTGAAIYRGLVPSDVGTVTLTGSFGSGQVGAVTGTLDVTVSNDETTVTAVVIGNVDYTSSGVSTLNGYEGETDNMDITVTFDDSTTFVVATSGQTISDWLQPSTFLTFASSNEDAITVSTEGVLELQANYYSKITLTASDACGSGVTATRDVYANLAPEAYDVDVGSLYTAPFGTQTSDTFSVDVRVQSSTSGSTQYVTSFQIRLYFDNTVIQVANDAACSQGSGWSSSFSCTTNDPPTEVLLVGSCGLTTVSSCASSGLKTIASITFTAVSDGMTTITGDIEALKASVSTTSFTTIENVAMKAGADTLYVDRTRRRLLAGDFAGELALGPAPSQVRSLVQARKAHDAGRRGARAKRQLSASNVLGDTNGDGKLDVNDVQYLQYYIGGAVSVSDQDQITAMDPDVSGSANAVDVGFMMSVIANKYRFIKSFSNQAYPFKLNVTLWDSSSAPVASSAADVAFEIGTNDNHRLDFDFEVGQHFDVTKDGVYIVAEVKDETNAPGVYSVEANHVPFQETDKR